MKELDIISNQPPAYAVPLDTLRGTATRTWRYPAMEETWPTTSAPTVRSRIYDAVRFGRFAPQSTRHIGLQQALNPLPGAM